MYTTKTGVKVLETKDKYNGPYQLLEMIQQLAEAIDKLSDRIDKLEKQGMTIYASEDTATDS